MKKSNYWLTRQAEKRVINAEKIGNSVIKQTSRIYEGALRNINREINKIYELYSNKTGLSVDELSQIIRGAERQRFLISIQEKMRSMGFRISDVYDENYLRRLTRLEAMKHQVYWEIMKIAPQEEITTGTGYSKVIAKTYESITYDMDIANGLAPSFATIDNRVINDILREKWVGRNYSISIWNNVSKFANELPIVLGAGLSTGQSYEKTARILRERFDVSRYNAVRLVRTETNYFHGQSELQSYMDDGIERYEFVAMLDNRTSKVCEGLDGKVFEVLKAEAGVNFNPMHVNCRSTTKAVLNGREKFERHTRNEILPGEEQTENIDPLQGPTKKQYKKTVEDAVRVTDNKPYHRRDLENVETLEEAHQKYLESLKRATK
jgi:SPP1 gp7 family putative phage head morphogenesis protein